MSAEETELNLQDIEAEDALVVDVEGYDGPLHVLLMLAREQKVDLRRISVLKLAEQYLEFIHSAQNLRLELAADYLVMASWLAFLKSRLLLPQKERVKEDEPDPEEMARRLAWRLKRLEAMRQAAEELFDRSLLGQDVFGRGDPEVRMAKRSGAPEVDLWDMLKVYANQRSRGAIKVYVPKAPVVFGLEAARKRLESILGEIPEWRSILEIAPQASALPGEPPKSSCLASTFAASLELARDGRVEMRQTGAFAPLYVRARSVA